MNRVHRIVSNEELIRRAEVYQDFCEKMMAAYGPDLFEEGSLMRSRMTEVSFMFLGKKPAMLWEEGEVGMAEMLNIGFKQSGLITYSDEAVQEVIASHPDVFTELPPDPQTLIELVSSSSDEMCTVALGLLMGFPKTSVLAYATREKDVAASQEAIDIHGMAWIDPHPNAESTALQQELEAVYKEAGIDQILESCKYKVSLIDVVADNHRNFSHLLTDAE